MYNLSGLQMLANRKGDVLENIEGGVAADIALEGKLTIVRSEVVKALNGQKLITKKPQISDEMRFLLSLIRTLGNRLRFLEDLVLDL